MPKIGVLSDTHGHLDPQVVKLFKGVDHILHAGDIGLPWLVLELEYLAPVTAVCGNSDTDLEFKETALVHIADRRFLVHHIVDLPTPEDRLRRRIIRDNPDVVVFGHTHKRHCETIGKTLYLNPGYAGKRKGDIQRSVAILDCDDSGITVDFVDLD